MKVNFFPPTVPCGSLLDGNCYVTPSSDNACVMTLKSRAHVLTNHNHTGPTSQILRDQETAHHASRIHGCVTVENEGWKLGFQEQSQVSVSLKEIIATIGSIMFIFGLGQEQEGNVWIFFLVTSKSCQIRSPTAVICKVKFRRKTQNILWSTRTEIKHCSVKP
jgi:hypothetical protein